MLLKFIAKITQFSMLQADYWSLVHHLTEPEVVLTLGGLYLMGNFDILRPRNDVGHVQQSQRKAGTTNEQRTFNGRLSLRLRGPRGSSSTCFMQEANRNSVLLNVTSFPHTYSLSLSALDL